MQSMVLTRRQMVAAGASLPLASAAFAVQPDSEKSRAPRSFGVQGTVQPGFERVRAAFEENFAAGMEVGASFAVYRDGEALVDLWGGSANAAGTAPVTDRTLYTLMSATKGLTSICVAMLVDRGKLDYEAPVAKYWPEFAASGKSAVTVGQLMSHQAGLTGTRVPVTMADVFARTPVAALLAAQEPFFKPGMWGYHAESFGILADQLVRRTDGRPVGRFFAEEVASRLGVDAFLGLPDSEADRAADLVSALDPNMRVYDSPNPSAAAASRNIPSPARDLSTPNQRRWRADGQPASSGSGNARSLATVYAALVEKDRPDRKPLLSRSAFQQATRERVCGPDQSSGGIGRYAAGFRLNTGTMGSDPAAFGHAGFGGTMAFADTRRRLGIAYTPNRILNPDWQWVDPRLAVLLQALYAVPTL